MLQALNCLEVEKVNINFQKLKLSSNLFKERARWDPDGKGNAQKREQEDGKPKWN